MAWVKRADDPHGKLVIPDNQDKIEMLKPVTMQFPAYEGQQPGVGPWKEVTIPAGSRATVEPDEETGLLLYVQFDKGTTKLWTDATLLEQFLDVVDVDDYRVTPFMQEQTSTELSLDDGGVVSYNSLVKR